LHSAKVGIISVIALKEFDGKSIKKICDNQLKSAGNKPDKQIFSLLSPLQIL